MIVLSPALALDPVTEHNAGKLLPLMRACYPPVYAHLWADGGAWYVHEMYNAEAVRKDLAEAATRYWIVRWKQKPVGIFRLCLDQSSPDFPEQGGVKLHRVYLHPQTHGLGIGRALLEYAVDQASQLGRAYVWLEAMDTQTAALGFYKKMGYATTSTFRLTFERMHDHLRGMVRMVKKL